MGTVKIANKTYARYESRYNLHELKDLREVLLTPQEIVPGKALSPDFSFVFANSTDRLCVVHISLAVNGKYYFGYSIHLDMGQMSCLPSIGHKGLKCADTLFQCVINALKHCERLSFYHNGPTDKRLLKASRDALHEVNCYRIWQMTIFDIL